MIKTCADCGETKPISEFRPRPDSAKPAWYPYCRPCASERSVANIKAIKARFYAEEKFGHRCADCVVENPKRAVVCTVDNQREFDFVYEIGEERGEPVSNLITRGREAAALEAVTHCDLVCAFHRHQRARGRGPQQ